MASVTTYQIQENYELVVVICGVNKFFSEEEILEEIKKKCPATICVYRTRRKDKIWPLSIIYGSHRL